MKLRRLHFLVLAAAFGTAALFGFSQQAQAGAYAFSLTEVSNFVLTCAQATCATTTGGSITSGTTLGVTNFSTLSFNNTQSGTAALDAASAVAAPANPVPNGTIQQACLGNCPATLTNSPFAFFGVVPPLVGVPPPTNANFTDVANQLSGAIVTGTGNTAPASANTVAQTQIVGTHSTPLSSASITLSAGFVFVIAGTGSTTIGISFNALAQLIAALDPQGTNATATSSYEISITCAQVGGCGTGGAANNQTVFDWTPDGTTTLKDNFGGFGTITNGGGAGCDLQNSISGNFNGQATEVNTGSCGFAATVTLVDGVQYNFTIKQINNVDRKSVV